MILSRRVKLGATQLDSLDTSIVIRSVEVGTPSESVSTASLAGGSGQRILSRHWDTMDVTVNFAILLPKTALADRRAVWESVAAWALGGEGNWLRLNFIQDRRLWVDRAEMSAPGDFRNWTDEYTITFHAISVPFWQDEEPVSVTKSIPAQTETSFTLSVPGHLQTVADFTFTNSGTTALDLLSIWTDVVFFQMTGFEVAGGETLTATHVNGRLRIYSGSTNLLRYRVGGSGDDLYLNPGTNTIRVQTNKAGTLVMTASGRYV